MSSYTIEATASQAAPKSAVTDAASVRIISSLDEIEQIRNVWTSWKGHRDSDIDVYLTVCRANADVVRPHIIMIERGGVPDAMLVGRLTKKRPELKLGYRTFRGAPSLELFFVYGALRGNPSIENCRLFAVEIIQTLRRGEADFVFLERLRIDSPLYHFVRTMPTWLARPRFLDIQPHWRMQVPSKIEDFYARLSTKERKNRKWEAKKLLSDFGGDVVITCYQHPAEVDCLVQDAEHVAQQSYQRALGAGFSASEAIREFLRLQAGKGWLRAFVLQVRGKPCAFWIGMLYQGTFYSDFMAFDQSYGKYSVGAFLLIKKIEDFCSEKLDLIDFGMGDAWYKQHFSTENWQEARVYLVAPTIRGVFYNSCMAMTRGLDLTLKGLLQRTELLSKIKKAWRQRLLRKKVNVPPSTGR